MKKYAIYSRTRRVRSNIASRGVYNDKKSEGGHRSVFVPFVYPPHFETRWCCSPLLNSQHPAGLFGAPSRRTGRRKPPLGRALALGHREGRGRGRLYESEGDVYVREE